jgi:hypothetical protein
LEVTSTAQGIASRVLARTAAGNITLFAFDAGEELSEHTARFDALVLTLSDALVLTIGGRVIRTTPHSIVLMHVKPDVCLRGPLNDPGGNRPVWQLPGGVAAEPAREVELAVCGALATAAVGVVRYARVGRQPPSGPIVDLAFPLRHGTYVVANGGTNELVSAHMQTLSAPQSALNPDRAVTLQVREPLLFRGLPKQGQSGVQR